MPLTDQAIKAAKPKDKPYRLTDERGMYLEVHPNGSRYWRLKYRYAGKEKRLAIGVYPEVSLKEARNLRDEARKQLVNGIDPSEEKRRQRRHRSVLAANSFEVIAREWHDYQKGRWSTGHADRVIKALEKDAFPRIGKRPIAEITAADLLEVIRAVEKRDALDVASRLLQRCSSVFRYAIQTDRAESNPANDLQGALKTRKVTHRRALSRAELPEFLERLEAYEGQPLTRLALRLIVLTFVRSRELRGARWEEFDMEEGMWRIPAERMKMKRDHLVPLSKQAVATLKEVQALTGSYQLAFPNQSDLRKSMSENTLIYALYRMGYHKRATVHGFRATASTILNESGFNHDAIERQLAHAERNKVRAAYHRSEYLEDRKRMMQWWADFLDEVKGHANVVPLLAGK